jgi:transcription elongation factor Elf1
MSYKDVRLIHILEDSKQGRTPHFVYCPICKAKGINNILCDLDSGSGVIRIKCKRCKSMYEIDFTDKNK